MSTRLLRFVLMLALPLLAAACGDRATPDPESVHPAQHAEAERVGFPVEVVNDLGMRFRLVPTGAFTMGSPGGEVGRREDETPHEVHLVTPCYIQTTEVTNAQFRAFRPEHDSGGPGTSASLDGDDQPVVDVTYEDALRFAAWLHERDPRWVYRLPTEAEFEFACREGVEDGPEAGGCEAGTATGGEIPRSTRAVGLSPPNAFGLHDLHGNVAEWCHDRYGPYAEWRQDNPQGSTTGEDHVVRGGSYGDEPPRLRTAAREHHARDYRSARVGFRLAFGLGYARHEYGAHEVRFVTIDPTAGTGESRERPGYAMRMISVIDRLTDRQNAPDRRPRWTEIPTRAPTTVRLWPGRYYVYCYRTKDGEWSRGLEVKFDVPDLDVILVPVPREDQAAPQ